MSLNRKYEIISKNNDIDIYFLHFDEYNVGFTINIPTVLLSLLKETNSEEYNVDILFKTFKYIIDYLNENNLILMYVCATDNINRNNMNISPQEYRFNLFKTIYNRYNKNNGNILSSFDMTHNDTYATFFTTNNNKDELSLLKIQTEQLNNDK